jgi:30S ribosomal protein S31
VFTGYTFYKFIKARIKEREKEEDLMGKGDKRTKKGKIWRGSHGNSRPKKVKKEKDDKKDSMD